MSDDDVKRALERTLAVHSFARIDDEDARDERVASFESAFSAAHRKTCDAALRTADAAAVVSGVTLRDLGDATHRFERLRDKLGGEIDNDALIGEVLCLVEEMLGTYPNTGRDRKRWDA